jgi:predicted small lipoprotein YifL
MRLLSRLLVSALLMLALAACGKKPEAPAPDSTEKNSSAHAIKRPHQNIVLVPVDYSKAAVNEPMPPIDESKPLPVVLMRGPLQAAKGMQAKGWVSVYRLQDNTLQLRIESLEIAGVANPIDVVLLQSSGEIGPELLKLGRNVGPLKGLSGRMGYPLADDWLSHFNAIALRVHGSDTLVASAELR